MLRDHAHEIGSKAGIAQPLFEDVLDLWLENIELVPSSVYEKRLREALRLVYDESDAPFAALALIRSPSTVVTYNRKHYNSRQLLRRSVQVLTPVEAVRKLD
jgi:predicted nucleic acid-binding protein